MLLYVLIFLIPLNLYAEPLQRQVIAFWDSSVDKFVDDSLVHRTIEMPLNYLGLDVVYLDIRKPLPELSKQDGIRGVIVSFQETTPMEEPETFIRWAIKAIDLGKKIILMENTNFQMNTKNVFTSFDIQNRLYEKMGFTSSPMGVDYPYDYRVLKRDEELFPFEKPLPSLIPAFNQIKLIDTKAKSLLTVGIPGQPESESDLIVLSPSGAFVSPFYASSFEPELFTKSPRSIGWYFNPFLFFQKAFNMEDLPVPDATTLAGRRIFIATCHGDNWNGRTLLEEYRNKDIFVSEVILEKIIKPNPDIPTAVGLVAADFDPKWAGKKRSPSIARKYYELPQVEPASHTYSHPFDWSFFEEGGPEKEIDFLSRYPYGSWQNSFVSWFQAKMYETFNPRSLKWGYTIPRAYANEKFNLEKEITGSVDYLNQFTIKGKPVALLLWSGDGRPWKKPIELCEKAGINQFSGGFVRFDSSFPSVLFVYPLARKLDKCVQLYDACNAENSYTNAWKDNFYGYQYLPETLENTDSPRRLKPMQLYYHSYSGEFQASVDALLSNIAYIRTKSPIALRVARYCTIGNGFFTAQFESEGQGIWRVRNRMGLQTIRFDGPERGVDFSKSQGVIGEQRHEGSLYVYLDAAIEEPLIALKKEASNNGPYLVDSSWEVWDLKREKDALNFKAQGWGKLEMRWSMPTKGTYVISGLGPLPQKVETSADGTLKFTADLPFDKRTEIGIKGL